MAPGTPAETHLAALEQSWAEVLAFKPDLILASAGFDAYAGDPITDMRLRPKEFAALGRWMHDAPCPVGAILEGGYSQELPGVGSTRSSKRGRVNRRRHRAAGVSKPRYTASRDSGRRVLALCHPERKRVRERKSEGPSAAVGMRRVRIGVRMRRPGWQPPAGRSCDGVTLRSG